MGLAFLFSYPHLIKLALLRVLKANLPFGSSLAPFVPARLLKAQAMALLPLPQQVLLPLKGRLEQLEPGFIVFQAILFTIHEADSTALNWVF